MTLPTTTLTASGDDDSDMFGPPRSSPPIYHHHRSRVPMISPKLRQREERKRILQLCAHKLERIKDSEANLRRSVCINNTYCRLTDELRREKQSRYLANLPKTESKPESARDNIFNPYNSCGIDSSNHQPSNKLSHQNSAHLENINSASHQQQQQQQRCLNSLETMHNGDIENLNSNLHHHQNSNNINNNCKNSLNSNQQSSTISTSTPTRKRQICSSNLDNDLEILERELTAINAPMPLIDPELTQGAEQLEKAMISSRKRLRSEDESDRLVREALSQFYIPPQRLISAIEDCPLDMQIKRPKNSNDTLELEFDMNQNQKEFEVIMDALRLGTPSPTPSTDSCGQAAMMSESTSVFHNLVVTSLET